jgi:hypothetical protein
MCDTCSFRSSPGAAQSSMHAPNPVCWQVKSGRTGSKAPRLQGSQVRFAWIGGRGSCWSILRAFESSRLLSSPPSTGPPGLLPLFRRSRLRAGSDHSSTAARVLSGKNVSCLSPAMSGDLEIRIPWPELVPGRHNPASGSCRSGN